MTSKGLDELSPEQKRVFVERILANPSIWPADAAQIHCDRAECVRAKRALKHSKQEVAALRVGGAPQSLAPGRPSAFWLLCMAVSFAVHVLCIQQGNVALGTLNFIVGFLPLFRGIFVETRWYWKWVSLAAVAVSVSLAGDSGATHSME